VNPPLAAGALTPYFKTGAIALNQNQTSSEFSRGT
jgi:hypothetical protein